MSSSSHPQTLFQMAQRRPSVSFVYAAFLLFLLLSASAMGEGRTCESQSHRFKGPCVRKSNCGAVCRSEGFHWGHCRGFRRRCFCTKHC